MPRPAPRAPRLALLLVIGLILGAPSWPPAAPAATPRTSAADVGTPVPAGRIARRALGADPAQEYLIYVPRAGGERAPVFVTAHGISRNAEEHATLFAPYAEARGVVLVAPCFTRDRHDDYQRLGRVGRGRRADLALDAILEEVGALTGAATGRIHLFGFSGGAQFAHRYAMAHPDRVAGVVVASAGWYTFPDAAVPYPYGLRGSEATAGVRLDPDAFLRVPLSVLVGGADTTDASLRRNAAVDRQQGRTRRERATNWAAAMRRAARARGLDSPVACEQVPGIGHSFRQFMLEGGLGDRVFAALFGSPVARGGP